MKDWVDILPTHTDWLGGEDVNLGDLNLGDVGKCDRSYILQSVQKQKLPMNDAIEVC